MRDGGDGRWEMRWTGQAGGKSRDKARSSSRGNNWEILPETPPEEISPPLPLPLPIPIPPPLPLPAGGDEADPPLPTDANSTESSLLRAGGDERLMVGRDDAVV